MNTNLDKLSKEDLEQLKKDVDKALKSVDARRKAEAKRAADQAAKEYGFSLDDLFGSTAAKGTKGLPKYANPADPTQTWTGRGRKPGWVNDALKAGKSLDDLAL
ncbi:H-NS histone family protein [Roseivivax lentus]|nr:H-NS histone family protein [Roseivivax lentus]